MKRVLAAAALSAGLLVASALPAFAHAELNQKQVEANQEIDLVLTVPSEKEGQHNAKIVVELPEGFQFRNCIASGNWACSVQNPTPTRTVITWAPVPGNDQGIETFQLRVQASTVNGPARFEVNQFYSNGDVVHWDNPDPDSDNPAPSITVVNGSEGPAGTGDGKGADSSSAGNGDGQVGTDDHGDGQSHDTADATENGAEPTITSGAAALGGEAAADDASEDKDTNYMALYIIIAFWLIVAIPTIVAGTRYKGETHDHANHH